jgi:hypothetical protein
MCILINNYLCSLHFHFQFLNTNTGQNVFNSQNGGHTAVVSILYHNLIILISFNLIIIFLLSIVHNFVVIDV